MPPIRKIRTKNREPGWVYRLRRVARLSSLILLLSIPVVLCWLLGGVEVWVQVVAFSLLLVAICTWSVAAFRQNVVIYRGSTIELLFLGAICLGLFQCLVLPREVVGVLSPGSIELRQLLVDGETTSSPLSLAPALTRHSTALLALTFITFIFSSQVFCRSGNLKLLFWVLAINGGVIALVGVYQQMTSKSLLFSVPIGFATFINENNAAGFLNICLAAALGLIFETRPSTQASQHYELLASNSPAWSQKIIVHVLRASEYLTTPTLAAVSLTICIVVGIFAASSRGGIISSAFAIFVLFLSLRATAYRKLRLGIAICLIFVAVCAIGLTQYAGQYDPMAGKLATLTKWETYESQPRFAHLIEMLPAIPDFWLFGSGLGTYGDVNRVYQRWLPGDLYFQHADNQYLEALIEGGVIGLAIMLVFVLLVCGSIRRLFRGHKSGLPIAVCGCFAMASQLMHATCDFGISIPANAVAFAIICGAVVGRDKYLQVKVAQPARRRSESVGRDEEGHRNHQFNGIKQLIMISGILMISLLALRELRSAQRAEQVISDPASRLFGWEPSLSEADRLPVALEVIEDRLDDARLQLFTAEMYIEKYRVLAAIQLHQELRDSINEEILDQATSLQYLHWHVSELKGAGADAELERICEQAVIQENLQPARAHLLAAQRSNPMLLRVHIQLAALSFLEEELRDQVHLERARLISPKHPAVLYWTGLIDLAARRSEHSWAQWKMSLETSNKFADRILDEAHRQLPISEIIDKVLPDSPSRLIQLSKSFYSGNDNASDRIFVLAKAEDMLSKSNLSDSQRHFLAASIDQMQGEFSMATSHYLRALELSPKDASYRHGFAQLLLLQGNLKEARKQVSLACDLEPRNGGHERLLRAVVRAEEQTAGKGANPEN